MHAWKHSRFLCLQPCPKHFFRHARVLSHVASQVCGLPAELQSVASAIPAASSSHRRVRQWLDGSFVALQFRGYVLILGGLRS